MKKRIKGMWSIVCLSSLGSRSYILSINMGFIFLTIVRLLGWRRSFYSISTGEDIYKSLEYASTFIFLIIAYIVMSIIIIPKNTSDSKLNEIVTFLPIRKNEKIIIRNINFLLISIYPLVLYWGLYMISVEGTVPYVIRGMMGIAIFDLLIYLTLLNISRFFKRLKKGQRIVKVIGIIFAILVLLIFPTIYLNIVNNIHRNSLVQILGGRDIGIMVGIALFTIYFIFNYWYVRRQVYKKG